MARSQKPRLSAFTRLWPSSGRCRRGGGSGREVRPLMAFEPLEDRRLLAPVTLSGRSFEDLNANGLDDIMPQGILPVGHFDWVGEPVDVHVVGDRGYVADTSSGLKIFDVSDPATPAVLGSFDTPGAALGVHVADHLAFVADGSHGLQIVDVADPAAPAAVSSFDTAGYARDLQAVGDLLFVADGSDGLLILNVSNPLAPVVEGSVDTPGSALGTQVLGSLAFVADGSHGLQIVDVSDPTTPTILGSYDTPGAAREVRVRGDLAYLADYDRGLQIVDVSDPTAPVAMGSLDTPGSAIGIDVAGTFACVADEHDGLRIVDVGNPAAPAFVSRFELGSAEGVQVVGNLAYLANASYGFQILDITNPVPPATLGEAPTPQDAVDVEVVNDLAFVAVGESGLQILDVRDPATLAMVGSFDTSGSANDVEVVGDLAYLADGQGGLLILDVSDPAVPVVTGNVELTGLSLNVHVVGDYAYVANRDQGLRIVDVSDPAAPWVVGTYDPPGFVIDVHAQGDLAYVADSWDGLLIVDVSNPADPRLVGGSEAPSGAISIHVADNRAYLGAGEAGFFVMDVDTPSAPALLGSCLPPGYTRDVQVEGHLAFLAIYGGGFQVVDVSDPAALRSVVLAETPGRTYGVQMKGGLGYIADGDHGVRILNVGEPGMGGVQIELIRDGDVFVGRATTVAGTGGYSLVVDEPGTYFLREVLPDGHVPTAPADGFRTVTIVTTDSDSEITDLDFGNAILGSIHGLKFDDLDGNGLYEPGTDQPRPGAVFTLTGIDGPGSTIHQTTTTDAAGGFDFVDLLPSVAGDGSGTGYTVREITAESGIHFFYDRQSWETALVAFAVPVQVEDFNEFPVRTRLQPGTNEVGLLDIEVERTSGNLIVEGTFSGTVNGTNFWRMEAATQNEATGPVTPAVLFDEPVSAFGADWNFANAPRSTMTIGDETIVFSDHFATGTSFFGVIDLGGFNRVEFDVVSPFNTLFHADDVGFSPLPDGPSAVPTTPTAFSCHLYSGVELVADAGDAMLQPGDPQVEMIVGQPLMFGSHVPTETLMVDTFTATPWGCRVDFNRAVNVEVLSLYDVELGVFGAADVTVVGDTAGPIPGSLVVDGGRLTFVATGGLLSPDNYTLTLRSANNAIQDNTGELLDGDGDGVPGGDYETTFTVEPDHVSRVLALPDFSRGPDQRVAVPATANGIPLTLSDGDGVSQIQFTLGYDPALLHVTGVTSLPAGWQGAVDRGTPGQAVVSLSSLQPLAAGEQVLCEILADVPSDAPYAASTLVTLNDCSLGSTPVPGQFEVQADGAVQTVAYLGDATGNRDYSGLDAQRVARVSVGLDGGFEAFPTIDSLIIGDVTRNGKLSGWDAQRIAQMAVGINPREIPPLPEIVDNLPPEVVDQAFAVDENVGAGEPIGVVEAHDPDELPQPLTFALTGNGADDLLFSIAPRTGALAFKNSPDFENPSDQGALPRDNNYEVEVQVSDGELTDARLMDVSVRPLNDNPPRILTESFPEVVMALFVGYVVAEDDDLPAQNLEFSITGNGADDHMFELDPVTGELRFRFEQIPPGGLDREIFEVEVGVTDGELWDTRLFEVTVDLQGSRT